MKDEFYFAPDTISPEVIRRVNERGELAGYTVEGVNMGVTITERDRERVYHIPRADSQEQIVKGDVLYLRTEYLPKMTLSYPFAFRHRNSKIYFRI